MPRLGQVSIVVATIVGAVAVGWAAGGAPLPSLSVPPSLERPGDPSRVLDAIATPRPEAAGPTAPTSPAARATPAPLPTASGLGPSPTPSDAAAPASSPTSPGAASPTTAPAAATPTSEPMPTETPIPTPTVASRLLVEERFVDNRAGWPNDRRSTAWLLDGRYHLFARRPGQHVAIRAPLGTTPDDVEVTARFHKVDGPAGGGYGVIVRDQGAGPGDGVAQIGSCYVFEVGDRGEFGVWRRGNNQWIDLVPWTASTSVRTGTGVNLLTARAEGSRLTFVVNGVTVATLDDPTLRHGAAGLFVGGDLNEAEVDLFVVRALAPRAATP